ncbi:hypothetical protein FJZ40_03665 [Candidatus Shapirobacteria bacterium]|nr:hypothetical protein [Candidatus Shapirobacteria bacterium]
MSMIIHRAQLDTWTVGYLRKHYGLVLVDGNAILHRAYHALPKLTGRGGVPINAVYGFCSLRG